MSPCGRQSALDIGAGKGKVIGHLEEVYVGRACSGSTLILSRGGRKQLTLMVFGSGSGAAPTDGVWLGSEAASH